MTKEQKVKELVEWVARTFWQEDSGNSDVWFEFEDNYKKIAKQILSHPDLALIVRDLERVVEIKLLEELPEHQQDVEIAFITPLAKVIKELK